MKIHSYGKKLMAAVCAVVMLVSCMVFAPVSAATAKGAWDCEAPTIARSWKAEGDPSDNTIKANYSMMLATVADGEAHSGNGVAVAKYTANGSSVTDEEYSQTAAGRLAIDTGSQNLTNGKYYRVVFYYKIKSLSTETKINFVLASRNWATNSFNTHVATSQFVEAATLKTTDPTNEWVKVDTVFQNATGSGSVGLHIGVQPVDGTKSVGTEVWLDDFEYYELEDSDFVNLTLNPNYDGASASTVKAAVGQTIASVAANPTRPGGYTFVGWKNADGETVTVAPTEDTTLFAEWEKASVVVELDGLQSFEDNADFAVQKLAWVEKEENHTYAGKGALKSTYASTCSQRTRPRLILQNNGQDVTVEPGKSYTVSFWMMTEEKVTNAGYYLATMADNSRDGDILKGSAGEASNAGKDVHKLQTLTSINAGKLYNGASVSTDGKGTEVGGVTLEAGEWTQITATFTATAHVDGKASYLALGITSEKDGGTKAKIFYLDDIQIAETDALEDAFSYDNLATQKYGSSSDRTVFGTGTARTVSEDVPDHTFGNAGTGKTLKINLNDSPQKIYAGINKASGGAQTIEEGHTYQISAWLYAAEDTEVTTYVRTADNYGVVHLDERINSDYSNVARTITSGKKVTLQAGQWQQVSYLVTIPKCDRYEYNATTGKEGTADDGVSKRLVYKYLALGFDKKTADQYIYMDDVSVKELTNSLDSFEGNVALYAKGNDTSYEDGAHGAMRFLGGYQTADGDATKAVIGGVTYTVKQRGIILGSETQTNLTLASDSMYVSTAKNGLQSCWENREGGLLTYSLLIKNVPKTGIDTKYNFRPYVTVEVDGAEVTLYGKEVDGISWSDVFAAAKEQNPALDNSWTTAE